MRFRKALVASALVLAWALPPLLAPHLAEAGGGDGGAALAPRTAPTTAPRDVRLYSHDPPPLAEKTQWVFDLRWDQGDLYLLMVRKIELPAPMATPRATGRFALELTEHGVLVERARFDFPLMGVPDNDAGVRIIPKLRTRIGVFFPATQRGDKLELVDRASGQRYAMPWPPTPGVQPPAQSPDGGAPAPILSPHRDGG